MKGWFKSGLIFGAVTFIFLWIWLIYDYITGGANYQCPDFFYTERCTFIELISSGWSWFPIILYSIIAIIIGSIISAMYLHFKKKG